MFSFLKSNKQGQEIKITLGNMTCTSCAVNVDLALEDLSGVNNSSTNFAKNLTTVHFDPAKVSRETILQTIRDLGYLARINS